MTTRPAVNDEIVIRNRRCRILRVYPFGTADVEVLGMEIFLRVTGLGWL
jgi:hypothetical protein